MLIPPSTNALLQLLNQEMIINVKAAYAGKTFVLLDAATDTNKEIASLEEKHVLAPSLPLTHPWSLIMTQMILRPQTHLYTLHPCYRIL